MAQKVVLKVSSGRGIFEYLKWFKIEKKEDENLFKIECIIILFLVKSDVI